MNKPKAEPAIDPRTLDALLQELKDVHLRLGAKLQTLDRCERLSEAYQDCLAEIYTDLTLVKCVASDLQDEMDRLTDRLPADEARHPGVWAQPGPSTQN